jgi:hypothetical protein
MVGVRPEHQAIIERLQPYKRGRSGLMKRLWLLHEINNADKHRTIQVVAGTTAVFYIDKRMSVPSFRMARIHVLEDGTKLWEIDPEDIPSDMPVESHLAPLILFWEGCEAAKGSPVGLALTWIADHVSEIVEGFSAEFS